MSMDWLSDAMDWLSYSRHSYKQKTAHLFPLLRKGVSKGRQKCLHFAMWKTNKENRRILTLYYNNKTYSTVNKCVYMHTCILTFQSNNILVCIFSMFLKTVYINCCEIIHEQTNTSIHTYIICSVYTLLYNMFMSYQLHVWFYMFGNISNCPSKC